MASEKNAIDIVHLTKSFGKFVAVDDLSMKVGKGEFMGLLGPNGAGKSTTLKCLTGMLKPTSGKILIDGINTKKHHRESLASVGCVIETPEFYPEFTPAEVLDYIGRFYGIPHREIKVRATDVLEEVRLWDWRHKKIGQFSKGMRQRVALAQALISNPSLIILDEPTSGLDPRGMIEMREVLNNLKNGERSLLISTHILKEVSEMCDYVTMINHGTTMISGNVDTLIKDNLRMTDKEFPVEIRTMQNVTDDFLSEIRDLTGVNEAKRTGDHSATILFQGTELEQTYIVDTVIKHKLGLLGLNVRGADLESLYMELTREDEVNIK